MPNGTYGGVGGKGAKENLSLPDHPINCKQSRNSIQAFLSLVVQNPVYHTSVSFIHFALVEIDIDIGNTALAVPKGSRDCLPGNVERRCDACPSVPGPVSRQSWPRLSLYRHKPLFAVLAGVTLHGHAAQRLQVAVHASDPVQMS